MWFGFLMCLYFIVLMFFFLAEIKRVASIAKALCAVAVELTKGPPQQQHEMRWVFVNLEVIHRRKLGCYIRTLRKHLNYWSRKLGKNMEIKWTHDKKKLSGNADKLWIVALQMLNVADQLTAANIVQAFVDAYVNHRSSENEFSQFITLLPENMRQCWKFHLFGQPPKK